MTVLLLICIYIIYIGLGVPDSVAGSALPAIFADWNIPVGYGSILTSTISLFTVVSSLLSARLINKFGTGTVTAVSTLLTAAALLGNAVAENFAWMIVCAVPTGLGAGAIDAALNNYVALHYKPAQLNFLHCFYGVGIALSPYLFSFALKDGGWRAGYRLVFYVQAAITVLSFLTLIIWKKVKTPDDAETEFTAKTLTFKEMAKTPAIRLSWLVFFSSCALEFTCDHWSTTFLVDAAGSSADVAAEFLSLYFIGMTAGRFLSGTVAGKIKAEKVIFIGYGFIFTAIVLLFLPVPTAVKGASLVLIGLGNGPAFPNLTYLTPVYFGKEVSQSVISSQMAMANVGVLVMPAVFGLLAQITSASAFPVYLAVLFASLLLSTAAYFKSAKRI